MNTTKTMTEHMSKFDMVALSLCAARPILGDQLAAIQGISVSSSAMGGSSARVLGSVPSIKAEESFVSGDVRPIRERDFAYATPNFADGDGNSASWSPPV